MTPDEITPLWQRAWTESDMDEMDRIARRTLDRMRDFTERLERGEPIPATIVREVQTPDGPMHTFERGTLKPPE